MTADAQPFDVGLTGLDFGAVAEGGAAIARVRHLPDLLCALHALDAKRARRLASLAKSIDQFLDGRPKCASLLSWQSREIPGEARRQPVGRGINRSAEKMPR